MKNSFAARALVLALPLLALHAGRSEAQVIGSQPWTTVGAAGTVNSGDTADVSYFTGGWMNLAAGSTSAYVRYNVVAVDGLVATAGPLPTRTRMRVKFIDPGETAHLTVTLKEFDLDNGLGSAVNRMSFDSDVYAPSNGFQTRDLLCEAPAFDFDFVHKGYFLEVHLSRPAGGSNPALGMVQLGRTTESCVVD